MSEEEEYKWRGSDTQAVMMVRSHVHDVCIQCVLAFYPSIIAN